MVKGVDAYLYDAQGKRYLDFAAGIATNALGHSHPALLHALKTQADQLWHCSNLFRNQPLEAFADLLTANCFADQVFFCSSGTEAVEAAIKTLRRYHVANGQPERTEILVMEGAFHGRSLGALSACTNPASKEGFGPLVPGFVTVPYHDLNALEAAITPHTAGIMLETIQGEGGVRPHSVDYLRGARALCDRHGILLFLDEIQCGYGRTGQLFAFEQAGIAPDICTAAKGIGGGFPLGAMLCTQRAAKGMTRGSHGSTYGSNPLACAVGHAVLSELLREGFLDHVVAMGNRLKEVLAGLVEDYPALFSDVRGAGLMLGLGLQPGVDKYALSDALREEGLLVSPAVSHVLRVLPPLIIDDAHISEAETLLRETCQWWRIDK